MFRIGDTLLPKFDSSFCSSVREPLLVQVLECLFITMIIFLENDDKGFLLTVFNIFTLFNSESTKEHRRSKLQYTSAFLVPQTEELFSASSHVLETDEQPQILSSFLGDVVHMGGPGKIGSDGDPQELCLIDHSYWILTRKVEPGNEVIVVGEVEWHDHCLLPVDHHHVPLGELLDVSEFVLEDGLVWGKNQTTLFMEI